MRRDQVVGRDVVHAHAGHGGRGVKAVILCCDRGDHARGCGDFCAGFDLAVGVLHQLCRGHADAELALGVHGCRKGFVVNVDGDHIA